MYRWRKNITLPNVTNMNEFQNLINNENWNFLCSHKNGTFHYSSVTAENDSAILIIDENFARLLLRKGHFFWGITDKCVPPNRWCDQLFSLLAIFEEQVYIQNHYIKFANVL